MYSHGAWARSPIGEVPAAKRATARERVPSRYFLTSCNNPACPARSRCFCNRARVPSDPSSANTFTYLQINGRPAFRYVASFTQNGRKHFEYFTRVLGDQMMVMFFTMGPLEEMETIRREVDQMSATVQVP